MAYSIDYIYRLIDKYSGPSKTMGMAASHFNAQMDKQRQKLVNLKNTLTSNIAKMIGWSAVIYGAGKAIKTGIQLASDLTEVQNVVDTTFQNNSSTIDKWSKTALEGFGLSELQAKKFNGTIGAMMKSTGIAGDDLVNMSTNLSGLAGDFASFYNLPHEEAFNKIRAGISGETEPLKAIGINMSVANLEAFALTQGITKQYKTMTQAEQVALRYNYLMSASADAQGDFSKTLDTSYANQMRILKTRFQQKLANAFKDLLPVLIKVLKSMNKFVDSIDTKAISKFIMSIVKIVGGFVKFLGVMKPILPIIIGIIAAWKTYQLVATIATVAQWAFNAALTANPIGLVITAIGILIGLIYMLIKNWDKVSAKVAELYEKHKWILTILTPGLVFIVEVIKAIVRHWDDVKKAFSEKGILQGILAIGKAILDGLLAPLQNILEVAAKVPKIGKWAQAGADKIKDFRENLFPKSTEEQMENAKKKTTDSIKESREEAVKPLDFSKIEDAQKKNFKSALVYREAQVKAREDFLAGEKYVSKPEEVRMREKEQKVSAEMNLRVYNETGAKIEPYQPTGNVGYNEVGR